MGFKEHLQDNLANLEHEVNMDDVWQGIEQSSQSKDMPFGKYFLLFGLVCVVIIGFYYIKGTSNKDSLATFTEVETPILFAKFDSEHSADRSHLLNETIENEKDEMQIAKALIYVIENDESLQVKLTAARALKNYTHLENVRIAIIKQMTQTNADYLKITLINLLTKGNIKDGIPALDHLLSDQQTAKLVKLEAEKSKLKLIEL